MKRYKPHTLPVFSDPIPPLSPRQNPLSITPFARNRPLTLREVRR